MEPLIRDRRAIGVPRRHQREFKEGGCPPVEHLDVHGIDLLELLSQSGVVVRVQHLRKGEDEVALEREGDVGGLEGRKSCFERNYGWGLKGRGEVNDDLGGLGPLLNARLAKCGSPGDGRLGRRWWGDRGGGSSGGCIR